MLEKMMQYRTVMTRQQFVLDADSNRQQIAVQIPIGDARIEGDLVIPERARGAVLFAHGSGSSRFSPRNRYVADVLHRVGLATLLMDLRTPDEEQVDAVTAHFRFDIGLRAERRVHVTDWVG